MLCGSDAVCFSIVQQSTMALVWEHFVPQRTQEFYDACDELGVVEPRLEPALVLFRRYIASGLVLCDVAALSLDRG